jgi:hypothetical protein
MLDVHPPRLVPDPQHRRQSPNRGPMDRLRVRTNGTRSLGSEIPLQHSMVHLEELFLRTTFSPWVLLASKRSIRRICLHAVRFPSPLFLPRNPIPRQMS